MGKKSRNKEQRRIVDSRAHSSRESSEIASRTSSIYSPPVPRQPYLPAPCLKSNVTELRSHQVSWQIHHENGVAGHRRRQGLLQYPGGHDLSVRRSVAPRLIDTGCGSHSGSLCKLVRAGIRSARLTPDFVGPFWTLTITDAPHHPHPGRRSSHPIRAKLGAFRHNHSAPGIQPGGDHSDTGLRPAHAPFARALPAALAGSYLQ